MARSDPGHSFVRLTGSASVRTLADSLLTVWAAGAAHRIRKSTQAFDLKDQLNRLPVVFVWLELAH
jgi:hypothetical protein